MKKEDFKFVPSNSDGNIYENIEAGEKRKQLLIDVMSGKISREFFSNEQKKMRRGKYLKVLYSESEYREAIK